MSQVVCEVFWLGQVDYQVAWDMQREMAGEIARGLRPATLLLLEHPPTFTFGRRAQVANLLWNEAELVQRGICTFWVDRGGDVTYHGPGQLVGYPLLPLLPGGLFAGSHPKGLLKADYTGYLRKLEQTLVQTLVALGAESTAIQGLTGVWVKQTGQPKPAKIAAIGVKVDANGVSQHGFALNVNPEMIHWEGIIACGLAGYSLTCLAEILIPCPTMEAVRSQATQAFGEVFGYELKTV